MNEPEKSSGWQAVKAVLWGFFGVRRRSDLQSDAAKLKPGQLIAVGLVLALLFVLSLIGIVKYLVASKGL